MRRITIDEKYCKGCLICINVCPSGVFVLSDKTAGSGGKLPEVLCLDKCLLCRMCERLCPEMCISVWEDQHVGVEQ